MGDYEKLFLRNINPEVWGWAGIFKNKILWAHSHNLFVYILSVDAFMLLTTELNSDMIVCST